MAVVSGRCPTFRWTAVEDAQSVDLVVYRLPEEESEDQPVPVLSRSLPGSAHGWTPSLGQCPESGQRYAWSLRAVGEESEGSWSEASLFQVAAGPSVAEVEQALAVLREYLESGGQISAGATGGAEVAQNEGPKLPLASAARQEVRAGREVQGGPR